MPTMRLPSTVVLRTLTGIAAAAAVFASAVFTTGCGTSSLGAAAGTSGSQGLVTGPLSGNVHGGQFPIYNATVKLYAAGTSGYGSAATLLATATTDQNGAFQFTKLATGSTSGTGPSGSSWACPTANPDPQIYITAIGGNTQGTYPATTNNAASALMAALGPCSTLTSSTQVVVNELTTAATVFALAQYMNPGTTPGTETIGTNGANTSSNKPQAALGLNNAVSTIQNLVSISTGGPIAQQTYAGTNPTVSGVTVTATPEQAKLITIANILAACVNTPAASSSLCTTLFAAATPPPVASVTSQPTATFPSAQDTLQAAYYMAVNPIDAGTVASCSPATTNIGCLFSLPSASAPFQPGLSSAPTDWTIGVTYTASGNCSNGNPFLSGPAKAAVDISGNLWFINGSGTTSTPNNFAELSPSGTPLFCAGGTAAVAATGGAGITIDPTGNIWTSFESSSTQGIQELPAAALTGSSAPTASSVVLWPTSAPPQQVVSDGYGNIFYNTVTGGVIGFSEFLAPGVQTTPFSATQVGTATAPSGSFGAAKQMVADAVGRIYLVNGSAPGAGDTPVELTQPSAKVTGYTVASGVATLTTSATVPAAFTPGTVLLVANLSKTAGLPLNRQTFTITAASGTTITATTSAANVTATTGDSGIAIVVPTTAGGYSTVLNGLQSTTYYTLAVDSANEFYTGNNCCGTYNQYLAKVGISQLGVPTGVAASGTSELGGNTGVTAMVLDGADNIWWSNEFPSTDPTGGAAESEANGVFGIGEAYSPASNTFAALSPAPTGLTGTDTCSGSVGCPIGGSFEKTSFLSAQGMGIDPSGNVWVLNSGNHTSGNNFIGTSITQVIGAAVPVVTPLSCGAEFGTLASKP